MIKFSEYINGKSDVLESKSKNDEIFYAWHDSADTYNKHKKYIDSLYKEIDKRDGKSDEVFDNIENKFDKDEINKIMSDIMKMKDGDIVKFDI